MTFFGRGLNPTAQDFSHAPGLCNAAAGKMRVARVKYFADGADAIVLEMLWKGSEKFLRAGLRLGNAL